MYWSINYAPVSVYVRPALVVVDYGRNRHSAAGRALIMNFRGWLLDVKSVYLGISNRKGNSTNSGIKAVLSFLLLA